MLAVIGTFALCLNGLRLDCAFATDYNRDVHSCDFSSFEYDGHSTLSLTGTHRNGKSNADVKSFGVWYDDLRLSSIPKGIGEFFPNLAGFGWYEGGLTTLTSEDLRSFPNLEAMSIWYNKLTSLDGDLFVHTPKIGYVNFGYNQLQNVGYGLLDGLNSLTRAHFASNPCINVYAQSLAEIQELKTLLLDQCPPSITTTTPTTTSTTVSATTDSGFCSLGCVELIEILEDENVRQNDVIAALQTEVLARKDENGVLRIEIAGLHGQVDAQQEQITTQHEQISVRGKAIVELEKQIREI